MAVDQWNFLACCFSLTWFAVFYHSKSYYSYKTEEKYVSLCEQVGKENETLKITLH